MSNEIETRLIHDGEPRTEGAVGVPIFQSSTFLTRGDESGYDDIRYIREHSLVTMIDNTFASPINFRPIEHGYDLSLHSATKYLNGHDDVVAGAVIGSRALVRDIPR